MLRRGSSLTLSDPRRGSGCTPTSIARPEVLPPFGARSSLEADYWHDRRMGLPEIIILLLIVIGIVFLVRRFAGRR